MKATSAAALTFLPAAALVLCACGAQPVAVPNGSEATSSPSGVPPATAALVPSATDDSDTGGLAGGSATVTLGGETYQLQTGDNPICMLTVGVQVGMASDDRTVSLTVHALGELNPTNFALITTDDRWVPADGSATFEVSGGRAAWSGTLVGQHTDREEDGVIEIVCGG